MGRAIKNKPLPTATQPKRSPAPSGDSKYVVLKNYLLADHKEAPKLTETQINQHQIIEKAWQFNLAKQESIHKADLELKYQRMRQAMLELEKVDPIRFRLAMQKDGEEMYFPRLLKAPTLTPGKPAWDYGTQPPKKADT